MKLSFLYKNMNINIYCYLLLIIFLVEISGIKAVENFGPYNVVVKKHEICNGPKGKNLTNVNLDVSANGTSGVFNMTYHANTRIDEIKIVVYKLLEDNKKLLWTYKLNDPCNHFATAAVIKFYYNVSNCVVKKGIYKTSVSFDETTKMLMGKQFFYGEYLLKIFVLSKQGNILCIKLFNEYAKATD